MDIPSIMRMREFESCLKGWEIKQLLGKGGYGEVYNVCKESKGHVIKDDCDYAVKVSVIEDKIDENRFLHEVDITKRMSNAGISPKLYEYQVCEVKGVFYGIVVVEKYDMTLTKYLQRNLLTNKDYAAIKALVDTMHRSGIAHLDLKHDNVMMKRKPKTFALIDYGFAVFVGKEVPLIGMNTDVMLDYYNLLYGDCMTKQERTNIALQMKIGNRWDPRHIDRSYLCSLKELQP